MPTLNIKDLQFNGLGPIDLDVTAGEIVCISGASGAGKSLLLRAIADMIPAHGQRWLDTTECSAISAPQWRKQVTMLPAETQWWHDSIGEHFSEHDQTLFANLALPDDCLSWQVSRCSTGEKQRLALLRMLAIQPQCLLLDEPTGSLDHDNTLRVEQLIIEMAKRLSLAVLWVSHSQEQIRRIAQRHYVMRDGQLVAA